MDQFPRVVFGSSALGNLYEALPDERKLDLVRAWFDQGGGGDNESGPVVIDTAGKYGAGLALEQLGVCLRRLGVPPERVAVGNKLGWYRVPLRGPEPTFEPGAWVDLEFDAQQRISGEGILECWRQGVELLGEPYRPRMMSVHDPDEYLAAASDAADRDRRWTDVLDAYAALSDLRRSEPGTTLGIGSKDWRVVQQITARVDVDWVMLANCVTAYTHAPEALDFIRGLSDSGVRVINSGVFNAGFLVGGQYFDYRRVQRDAEAQLFEWRDAFKRLCEAHAVAPAHACIQFGLSPLGVEAVALNTTDPDRVAQNLHFATTPLDDAFWREAKQLGLISSDYPYLAADAPVGR
ncbi:Pyridoxal 4-dehydrogenase [Pirellulimonas nuda]|uniref:Pyridoxal 4-dehydrogenase n=1 Tax=Pirellulimonas nuda TaxID=2528009 RepID=A0A518DEC1_9BACT|nr:aldo/keto reductase [Pirellulimonas nuda]QDU89813.1 Pyridoxal 4-dehydrogenase [Pirellulimonas nuda]